MPFKPARDPAPLVAEFLQWQNRTQKLLREWCLDNWVRLEFKNQNCAYQFMHYWLNHSDRRKKANQRRNEIRKREVWGPVGSKRERLLKKYGNLATMRS